MKRDKHRITLVPYHGGARLARYYGGAALAPFGSRWVRGPYLQSRYNQRSKNGAPFTETSGVELGLVPPAGLLMLGLTPVLRTLGLTPALRTLGLTPALPLGLTLAAANPNRWPLQF